MQNCIRRKITDIVTSTVNVTNDFLKIIRPIRYPGLSLWGSMTMSFLDDCECQVSNKLHTLQRLVATFSSKIIVPFLDLITSVRWYFLTKKGPFTEMTGSVCTGTT